MSPPGMLCQGCSLPAWLPALSRAVTAVVAGGCRDPCFPPPLPGGGRGDCLAGVPPPPRGTLWGWSCCRWQLPGLSFLRRPLPLGRAKLLQTPLCPQDLAGLGVGANPQLPLPQAGSCTQRPRSPACSGGFGVPLAGFIPATGSPVAVCPPSPSQTGHGFHVRGRHQYPDAGGAGAGRGLARQPQHRPLGRDVLGLPLRPHHRLRRHQEPADGVGEGELHAQAPAQDV